MENPIIQSLEHNPLTKEIIKESDHVGNLQPMEEALLLAAAFDVDQKSRIIVKKNRYEAMQLYSRLSLLVPETVLLTMEESLRVQSLAASPADRQELISGLAALQSDNPKLIIANTASFTRFLPKKEVFDQNTFTLKVGEEISIEDLKEKLIQAGYSRENYVDHPGTFASRGGIVDIFTIGMNHPVRIEFFDREIDSIRIFNEESQRTITEVSEARILPATDLLFSSSELEDIEKQVREQLSEKKAKLSEENAQILQDQIDEDMENLKSGNPDPYLYKYYSYISSGSILDYTDAQPVFSSQEDVETFYKNLNQDNTAFVQEMVQENKALPKYAMFHDLTQMEKERKPVYFHDFVSWKKPVLSNIGAVDPHTGNWTGWAAEEGKKDNVYFALEEEDKKVFQEKIDTTGFKFTEPIFYEGFKTDDFTVYTRRELFHKQNRRVPYQKTFKEGRVLDNVLELEAGDYVVHETYGIGQYMGIVTREQNGRKADYLRVSYKGGDDLYVPLNQYQLIRKYISKEGSGIRLSKLGSDQWEKTKARVSEKIEEIAGRLVDLYAARNQDIGFAYPKDGVLEQEFDEAFEYESTPDQLTATAEIKAEMEKPKPMDHLLCGDVGFGKTEVAMRCAFKAIAAGKQVAFLCPTTILSMQHYETLKKRFEDVGASIALVNRFTSTKDFNKIVEDLEAGTIDIVVGTHRLFNKKVKYKDLGFLIIDEEQRFGVEHKEKIKEMKNSIDVLSLSATPIPRTLQMSLIGVRTISTLNTAPAARHPVQTYVMEKSQGVVKEVIQRELARDGQVFYLHNRVQDIYRVAKDLQDEFPDAAVGIAHGRMSREEIENVMLDFSQGKFQILVCTTIIETGLDIANANTIIIEGADHFGLSQLYQIRGRVGRRDKRAFCYLMVAQQKQMTEQAQKRLKSIKEFTSLGSGYKIAMRDLTIRGAGDMLGPQQAGFIDQVGLDLYLEMLSEAIARKQNKEPEKEETKPVKKAQIPAEGYIPGQFTQSDGDKLALYQEVRHLKNMRELKEYEARTRDIFGRIPKQVQAIFDQKKLDLFVNEPGVDGLKETGNQITITMDPKWSREVDGLRLFEAVTGISRTIKMTYKNQMVSISFEKKKSYMDLLNKLVEVLQDPEYRKTR